MKTVFQFGGANPYKGAKSKALIQVDQYAGRGKRFTVTYGLQRKTDLNYADAARELGECIFHHLACDGMLDNDGE